MQQSISNVLSKSSDILSSEISDVRCDDIEETEESDSDSDYSLASSYD